MEPVLARSRRYPPLHRDYLKEHISSLEKYNLVYRNSDSRWGSAPRIVSNKEVGSYGMTVYLRTVNAFKISMAWPMPHLEVVLASLDGSSCYFSLDCFRFYWQLLLPENSRDYFTVLTPDELYTEKRIIMGSTDAVAFAQQVAESVLIPALN
uniref:PREDICTED: RETRotransposonlike family member (Retr1)like putative n=1 Tax=Albugo laibachii Nc14 TaxID=890382 RepID=F0W8I8_9STRA|nr:PREDICTED: RETRotransposonlike family member (retr1)like putative [Albugo laibachii Nc14]|eukprot:CCA17443.1 PREDICTED: RETRotransposonlike family member (retr1)like putative [Albugo laibachii Nc14]